MIDGFGYRDDHRSVFILALLIAILVAFSFAWRLS